MAWWFFQRKKVGLVLGGGVARGIAHIGVLKVLHAYKVPIDYIVGTSSGGLVGAAYAAGMDVALIEQVALHIRWNDLLKFNMFRPGFAISGEVIEDFVTKYIGEKNFSDLKIPFAAVATEIQTGEAVVINDGKISKALAASCAFPGFFAPAEVGGKFLIDGGIAANVPVDVTRELGADFVIASDVIPRKLIQIRDSLQAFGRSLDLVLKKLSWEQARKADVLIELEMEEDIWQLDFGKAKKLIAAGEVAAHRAINRIKRSLRLQS